MHYNRVQHSIIYDRSTVVFSCKHPALSFLVFKRPALSFLVFKRPALSFLVFKRLALSFLVFIIM